MKNKLLVYDSTKGYKSFIKKNFSKEFDCVNFFDYKDGDVIDYDEFAVLFFFVNDPMQLADLLRMHQKVRPVFLGTQISKIKDSLIALDDSVYIDLRQSRLELLDFIRLNLKLQGVIKD